MSGTNTLTTTGAAIDLATQMGLKLTMTTALTAADTMVTVELDADAVKDLPGNGIAAVAATAVIRVRAPGPPVLTAAAKDESIELTWTIAGHGTSNITRFEYRIKETTGGTYPAMWTDTGAAASNTGGSATIGSLTNGTQYTVQVRGVNSEGEGADSNEASATPDAPPEITSVAITSDPGSDNTYIIGDDIVVTFTFDKNITISGSGSEPYMFLFVGMYEREPHLHGRNSAHEGAGVLRHGRRKRRRHQRGRAGPEPGHSGEDGPRPSRAEGDHYPLRTRRQRQPQGRRREADAVERKRLGRPHEGGPHLQRGHRHGRQHPRSR